jgi:hypothetical protein
MIDQTPEISRFLQRYMKQFLHALTDDERALLQKRFLLEGGGEGFAQLSQRYAYPEHWQGLRKFIANTLRGLRALAAREAADRQLFLIPMAPEVAEAARQLNTQGHPQKVRHPILDTDGTDGQRYSLDEVWRFLRAEFPEAAPRSRKTLDNWGNAGTIAVIRDGGRKWLDSKGIEQVRTIVAAKCQQVDLVVRARAVGMTDDAIAKGRQRGTLEAIITRKESARAHKASHQGDPVESLPAEDLRAELKWQLSQAITEDERLDVIDQLRQLDQMHESSGRS